MADRSTEAARQKKKRDVSEEENIFWLQRCMLVL